jgi:chorismate synthase
MFRFLTSGESHGPGLTAIIEGLPAGLKLEAEEINYHLHRRQGGNFSFRSASRTDTWFTSYPRN